jgi:hypothetical protein
MHSSFFTRVMLATLLLIVGMTSISLAGTITLQAAASNSTQIKAIAGPQGKLVWEIQLGGGADQPPHDTMITGKATAVIGGKAYSGYYRLSTASDAQLRMINKTKGAKPGMEDVYTFLDRHNVLEFKFAAALSFNDPWLTARISNAYATQQVPSQENGDQHPPIVLFGSMTAPAGSLAGSFSSCDSKLVLNVGGNQRLLDLKPTNSYSGMNLKTGAMTVPDKSKRPD